MKRIIQIAKELNVGVSTILEYLERLGHPSENQNSKIDNELEKLIIQLNAGELMIENTSSKNEVSSTQELPNEFLTNNPFEIEQQEILSDINFFDNRESQIREYEGFEVKTIFTDFEAFSICAGLENRHAKYIARKFFNNKMIGAHEFIEAHQIASSALEKYGSDLISFMISLPPLPFKAVDATQIFSELDKRKKTHDFPILRITFRNEKNQIEKLQVAYYAEKGEDGRNRNDNVLLVKNRTTGKKLMKVSRNGVILPERNAKKIVPVLQAFIRFSKETKKTIINYGLETGECSICGRELTDPDSIRRGIGPICVKNI